LPGLLKTNNQHLIVLPLFFSIVSLCDIFQSCWGSQSLALKSR